MVIVSRLNAYKSSSDSSFLGSATPNSPTVHLYFQIRLSNGQCSEKPVPDCKAVGETGPLPKSPNHYYVCLLKRGILHPQVFICPHGWYFWDGFCRPEPQESVSIEKTSNRNSQLDSKYVTELETTVKPTTSKIEGFFSTEKAASYPPDTFLADRFDLSNYETTDDVLPQNEYANSFESNDFW